MNRWVAIYCIAMSIVWAVGWPVLAYAAASPPDTILMASVIHTRPDPESVNTVTGGGILRLRVDRHGNACLIGSSRVPGCGLLQNGDMPAILESLAEAVRLVRHVNPPKHSLSRTVGEFVTPLPPRAGHPHRFTGITVKAYVPPKKSQGLVMIHLHDAQIGGGGQYFLPIKDAEKLGTMLEGIPAVSRTLDARLARYEKEQEAKGLMARRPSDGDFFSGFPFNLLPLLGLFL